VGLPLKKILQDIYFFFFLISKDLAGYCITNFAQIMYKKANENCKVGPDCLTNITSVCDHLIHTKIYDSFIPNDTGVPITSFSTNMTSKNKIDNELTMNIVKLKMMRVKKGLSHTVGIALATHAIEADLNPARTPSAYYAYMLK